MILRIRISLWKPLMTEKVTSMKIAVFDPILAKTGHYKAFNKYILDLLDTPENEILLADISQTFDEWYSSYKPINASLSIVNVAERLDERKRLSNPLLDTIWSVSALGKERRWYKSIIEKITSWNPDLILITSQPKDGFFKIRSIGMPVAIVFHNTRKIDGKESAKSRLLSVKLKLERKITNSFLSSAGAAVILLEDYSQARIASLGYRTIRIPAYAYSGCKIELPSVSKNDDRFTISSLGTINKGKNIDFVLDVIQKHRPGFFVYKIAGNPRGLYGEEIVIKSREANRDRVITNFGYLSDEQYREEICSADFILIPYERSRAGQSSGVMFDAMNCDTPIIATDIEPFKTYIERYSIGLIYRENDGEDLLNAIEKARERGKESFKEAIHAFREEHAISRWRSRFNIELSGYICEWKSNHL